MGAFGRNMSACKVVLLFCLLVSLGLEIEGRGRGGGRRGGRQGWRKGGNNGHPLKNHLNPTWNGFDRFVNPTAVHGEPVKVEVNMFLREVGPLNLDDSSFTLQVTLRQVYNDSRLAYREGNGAPEHITLSGDELDTIWQPDTFVRNERKLVFHENLQSYSAPNMYARIYPDGKIQMSQRVTMQLSCPKLKYQLEASNEAQCSMDLASYGFKENEMAYLWKDDQPIQVNPHYEGFVIPRDAKISLKKPTVGRCDVTTSTGKYSCIRLFFVFTKN